ncbi:MAG: hypothetical protein ACRDAU_03170 [Clostridium sp.]
MANTLNLERDYLKSNIDPKQESNLERKPKSRKIIKIIISLLIIFIILIGCFFSFCFYLNSKDLNTLNLDINNYNTLISEVRSNTTPTSSDVTSYSDQFTNLASSFKSIENSKFIETTNKTTASKYNNLTVYLAANEKLLSTYLTLTSEAKDLNKSNLNDIQAFISKFNGILSTNEFTQMTNLYNNNTFVKQNILDEESPSHIQSLVDSSVKKLVLISKYEVLANNISNFFNLGNIFTNTYSK